MALLMELWSGMIVRKRLRLARQEAERCKGALLVAERQRDEAVRHAAQLDERNAILELQVEELMRAHKLRVEQLETEAAMYIAVRKKVQAGGQVNAEQHPRD